MPTLYPTFMWTDLYSLNPIQYFCKPLGQLQLPVMATACTTLYHWLFVVQKTFQLSVGSLITAYALLKHRTAMMDVLTNIYFTGNHHQHIQMFTNTVHKAIHPGVWGTDLHLFPLSLLLNRPIFTYTTFYRTVDSVRILELRCTPFSSKVLITRSRHHRILCVLQ